MYAFPGRAWERVKIMNTLVPLRVQNMQTIFFKKEEAVQLVIGSHVV